jgi:hypothetical protein
MAALRKSNAPPGVRRKATALEGRAHMRGRSLRVWLAGVFVLACSAAGLALVSVGHAGSIVGSSFVVSAQPTVLTTSGTGFAKGVFTAASGSGTGSATHVVITFRLPSALLNPLGTTSDCSTTAGVGENVVTCNLGTINAGQMVKRFVTFKAPSTLVSSPTPFSVSGTVSWDNGSGGAGGGGGINSIGPKFAQTTWVYAGTDTSHAGNCFLSGSGTVETPGVTDTDNQATSAQVGAAAPSLGLPCPFADVGEDPRPPGFITAISHDTLPQLVEPATITLTLNSLPIPFSKFSWLFSPDYPATLPWQPIPLCIDGQLPTTETIVCQLSAKKTGNGGSWTFRQRGTGGDPSFGH